MNIYPESDVRLGFGYLIALCSPAIRVPKFQVLLCIVDISHLRHHTFFFRIVCSIYVPVNIFSFGGILLISINH